MNKIIVVENIIKKYDSNMAVNDISFKMKPGDLLGIVGPNGAGKTTLLNMLTGFLTPDAGTIRYFSQVFTPEAIHIKKKIGVLTENLGLYQELIAQDFLYYISRFYGVSEKNTQLRMDELFDFIELEEDRYKFIRDYSAGMKKKLAICAAIIHKPSIVIMDEPFESIDPISIEKINKTLQRLAQTGTVVIVTSQILSHVEKLCSEILIINHGSKISQNKTTEIQGLVRQEIKTNKGSSLEQFYLRIMKNPKNENTLSFI
jgi:ABC-2 type transport system ATP-binding protein